MTGAMYAAVAGLRTHMSALNVISNNVSNVNTYGYKATRYTFDEALYTTTKSGSDGTAQIGGRNPAQVGYGCSVGTIDLDMGSGIYSPTGKDMDCMIDGDGFFMVGDKFVSGSTGVSTQNQLQGMTLTRLGRFNIDAQGYLVDGDGKCVYGFLRVSDEEGNVYTDACPVLTAIRLPMCTRILNEDTGNIETTVYYPESSGGEVRDRLAVPDGDRATERLSLNTIAIERGTGKITGVSEDGQQVVIGYIAVGKVDNPEGVSHIDGRYFSAAMGGAGTVHLSSFGGVVQYDPTSESAQEDVPWASQIVVEAGGDTDIISGGLEGSVTDLAYEISNMIVIQRGYQANTRIVTVTDSMLEELVNMKR